MDVVFNHTAEGNEMGPTISFRGFDNRVYYMIAPKVTQQPLGLTCSLVTFVGFSIILVSSFYWSSCLMYFILSLFKIAHFISGLGSLFFW